MSPHPACMVACMHRKHTNIGPLEEVLTSIDTTIANGQDNISAIMLKKTALSITPAVTKLFNVSLTSGELPSEWQIACVSPTPKSGDNSNPSNYRPVSSGVPQRSVLGPILFIIYIDGITKVALTAGNLSLFADDILLYRPIQNIEDFAFLQNDVTKLCSWTNHNLLDFKMQSNACKYMLISCQPFIPVVLTINGSPQERVDAYKYLGFGQHPTSPGPNRCECT